MIKLPNLVLACIALLVIPEATANTTFTDGFIREFQVSSPMTFSEANKFELKLLNGEIAPQKWIKHSFIKPDIRFDKLLSDFSGNKTLFVFISVDVPAGINGIITVGYNDKFKTFLNGKLIKTDLQDKTHSFIRDEERESVRFTAGHNTILLRFDNISNLYSFAIRVIDSPKKLYHLTNWLQPKFNTEFNNSGKIKKNEKLNDISYRYFTRPPFVKRALTPKIRHAIMGPMFREYYKLNPLYVNGSRMPCPDILELRTPSYSLYDAQTGKQTKYMKTALDNALATEAPQIEVSPVTSLSQHPETNPEVAADIKKFYKMWFKENQPEQMVDHNGNLIKHGKWDKPEINSSCYSYHDSKHKAFVLKTVTDITKMLRDRNDPRIGAINCRYPSNNDWYYPIKDEFYDYSLSAQKAYRKFLKAKYGSVEKLNNAYGTKYTEFEAIKAPKPKIGEMDLSHAWQDWQAFRTETIYELEREIFQTIRKNDPNREIVSWMTTSLVAAARDGVVLDDAMRLSSEFPNTLMTLTCFDFMGKWLPLSGELWGQLAIAYKQPISMEPLHNAPDSYLKAFYNVLRFPIKKANWLYWTYQRPSAMPWVIWVMNQRGLADELSDAELIQEQTVNLFSYSDIRLQTPEKLNSKEFITGQYKLYNALQSHNINLPMITDYSLSVDFGIYKSILLADTKLLRPEMISKISKFVKNGGTAIVLGNSGEYNLNTGERDYPLLRELGARVENIQKIDDGIRLTALSGNGTIVKSSGSLIEEASWTIGKGRVVFHGKDIDSLLNKDGLFNSEGLDWLRSYGISPMVEAQSDGLVASFVKAKGKVRYIGFININGGAFSTDITFKPAQNISKLQGVELVSGENIELNNGRLELNFDIPWEVKVIKLEIK